MKIFNTLCVCVGIRFRFRGVKSQRKYFSFPNIVKDKQTSTFAEKGKAPSEEQIVERVYTQKPRVLWVVVCVSYQSQRKDRKRNIVAESQSE